MVQEHGLSSRTAPHVMVDGVMTHTTPNPNGPSALTYAWIAPFIGALIRVLILVIIFPQLSLWLTQFM